MLYCGYIGGRKAIAVHLSHNNKETSLRYPYRVGKTTPSPTFTLINFQRLLRFPNIIYDRNREYLNMSSLFTMATCTVYWYLCLYVLLSCILIIKTVIRCSGSSPNNCCYCTGWGGVFGHISSPNNYCFCYGALGGGAFCRTPTVFARFLFWVGLSFVFEVFFVLIILSKPFPQANA